MWVNGIWIEHIKKPRRSKHLAYVARDYIEDADFEEITKGDQLPNWDELVASVTNVVERN